MSVTILTFVAYYGDQPLAVIIGYPYISCMNLHMHVNGKSYTVLSRATGRWQEIRLTMKRLTTDDLDVLGELIENAVKNRIK